MIKRYHIPAKITWDTEMTSEENARLERAILAAIRRVVESVAVTGGEIVSANNSEAYADARARFSPGRFHPDRGTYTVPSFQEGGAPTEVPVESAVTFEAEPIISYPDQVIEQEPPFQKATVMQLPGNRYVHVSSHRYATTGNIGRAYNWARGLFGAEAWVIATKAGRRGEVTYYVAALDEPITEADLRGKRGEYFYGRVLERLPGGYTVAAVGFKGGGFSAPTRAAYESFVNQVKEAREQGTTVLDPQMARTSIFKPIDDLIAQGGDDNLQRASELLSELNATAFTVLDWETKGRYLRVLIDAWTEPAQEVAIVEIIKSISSRTELDAALGLLRQAGVYQKLFDDLDKEIWRLLVEVGQRFGEPGPLTFDFFVTLLQEAGLMPRNLEDVAKKIILGPAGPFFNADLLAELEEAARGFVRFLGGALEGIVMLVAHPDKLIEGIGQLVKMAAMFQLAQVGYQPAVEFTNNLLNGLAQQVLHGLKGAQVLGISGHVLRRVKWAVVWEVASWFIGVAEVKAILSGVGITEQLAAVARFLRAFRLLGRATDVEKLAAKLEHLARLLKKISIIEKEEDVLRLLSQVPEQDVMRLVERLESAEVHAVQDMAELTAKHPELAEVARHAIGRAEALYALEKRAGQLTDNLVQGFQRLASRSGFNNTDLFNLMEALHKENAELFMRAIQAMPDRAFGSGIGARGYDFFNNLSQRPRNMQFLLDANYDTFSALYRHSNYKIDRFEEYVAALEDLAQKLPADQRAVGYRNLLDRVASNDPATLDELRQAVNARRAATGRPLLRSYTAAELDDIVSKTPDIQKIRKLANDMDPSTRGSLFERWGNRYVFKHKKKVRVIKAENAHLEEVEGGLFASVHREIDHYDEVTGEIWDTKIYSKDTVPDRDQLHDYRIMEEAGEIWAADGRMLPINDVNYLFSDIEAAKANASTIMVEGGGSAWYIDDHGALRRLN